MLYKHDRLEKELRESGRTAQAQILSMKTEGESSSVKSLWAADDDLTTQWTLVRMTLRVMPEGEPPFETTVRTRLNTFKYKGDMVPVLYDPADHDKVVVDYQADAKATMDQTAQNMDINAQGAPPATSELSPEVAALIQRSAAASAPAPPPAVDPLERLSKLGELHAQGVLTDAEFAAQKAKILAET
jgi:hypothetical protein